MFSYFNDSYNFGVTFNHVFPISPSPTPIMGRLSTLSGVSVLNPERMSVLNRLDLSMGNLNSATFETKTRVALDGNR